MTTIQRTEYSPYSPEVLFALVQDIERYPEFLPWCQKATILEKTDDTLLATLCLSVAGFERSFTTRNQHIAPARIQVSLADGDFLKHLEGIWTFEKIDNQKTKIDLLMHFEFSNMLLRMVASPIFEEIVQTLVKAFCNRAETLHGKSN